MVKLPRVQSLWIGQELSPLEILCIRSFLSNGHDFHLYVYDVPRNVPDRVVLRDANSVITSDLIGRFKYIMTDSVSPFSNVFRYKLLYDRGGMWVDMDVVCLNGFNIAEEYLFPKVSTLFMLGGDTKHVDSWCISVPKQSELMRYCYDKAMSMIDSQTPWGTLGPLLLQEAVERLGLQKYASTRFFPVGWRRPDLLTQDKLITRIYWAVFSRSSLAIHLYNEGWRYAGLDRHGIYDRDSIIEKLKRRYDVDSSSRAEGWSPKRSEQSVHAQK
jgi:hypothetical protein